MYSVIASLTTRGFEFETYQRRHFADISGVQAENNWITGLRDKVLL